MERSRDEINALEARIRALEKVETDRVLLVKQEMASRDEEYQEIIKEIRDEHERYRAETLKEIAVHEALGRRQLAYQQLLQKELIIATNIFKNPILSAKLKQEVGMDRLEIYSYPKPDLDPDAGNFD